MRNPDVQLHVSDAERARRAGDVRAAYDGFVEAGRCAEQYGLWKTALRCYRNAVEIDLFGSAAVSHLARIAGRAGAGTEWADYAAALAAAPTWPRIACRQVQLLLGAGRPVVHHPRIGTVLELAMPAEDLVEVEPEVRFIGAPVALVLVVLHRAIWPAPRETATDSSELRVTYRGRACYRLGEHGDWTRL